MALFVLSLCPFDISVGIGAFVIGLGQISSFLSLIIVRTISHEFGEWRFYNFVNIILWAMYSNLDGDSKCMASLSLINS